MRKTFFFVPVIGIVFLSCEKPNVTVNTGTDYPAYIVSGISDLSIRNGSTAGIGMGVSIQYKDSAQETLTLSLSALPPGISMDTTAIMSGVPSFNTNFIFYDTTQAGATPGTYPMTLTITGAKTGSRTFGFKFKVLAAQSYTTNIVGTYPSSNNACNSGYYSDSVYNDPSIINKIWFSNFGGYGITVYGIVNSSFYINIPSQTSGTYTVSGSGYLSGSSTNYYLYFGSMQITHGSNTNYCNITDHH